VDLLEVEKGSSGQVVHANKLRLASEAKSRPARELVGFARRIIDNKGRAGRFRGVIMGAPPFVNVGLLFFREVIITVAVDNVAKCPGWNVLFVGLNGFQVGLVGLICWGLKRDQATISSLRVSRLVV
jgi:hypothetical protein